MPLLDSGWPRRRPAQRSRNQRAPGTSPKISHSLVCPDKVGVALPGRRCRGQPRSIGAGSRRSRPARLAPTGRGRAGGFFSDKKFLHCEKSGLERAQGDRRCLAVAIARVLLRPKPKHRDGGNPRRRLVLPSTFRSRLARLCVRSPVKLEGKTDRPRCRRGAAAGIKFRRTAKVEPPALPARGPLAQSRA
jgi:hypothetical protein